MIGVMNMGRRASALFHSPRGNKKKKSKDSTGRPKFKQDFIKFTGNNTLNAHCCITIPLFFSEPRETKYCIIRTYNLFIPLCHVNTSTFADFLCKGWQQSQSYLASFIYSTLSKVVQEYERAVIFRLGRLRRGGAKVFHTDFLFAASFGILCICSKGPGIFFIIPCVDSYQCVDLRTVSFDVPPQEVGGKRYMGKRYIFGSNKSSVNAKV